MSASYCRFFADERRAVLWMQALNDAHANGDRQMFAVAPGPDMPDGPAKWAVMDLDSAIDLNRGYRFSPPMEAP